jgi:hypothetical protein
MAIKKWENEKMKPSLGFFIAAIGIHFPHL